MTAPPLIEILLDFGELFRKRCNEYVSVCSTAEASLPQLLTQKRLSQNARNGQMHAQIQGTQHSSVANMCIYELI